MTIAGGFRRALWRGNPFWALVAEAANGRRAIPHEYPSGETPYTEDLGRSAEGISIEGRLVGPDVHVQLELMRDAAREPGPGVLVHPTRGTMRLVCVDFRERVATRDARVAQISFDFVEAGEEVYPSGVEDAQTGLQKAAAAAKQAATVAYQASVIVSGPEFLREGLTFGADLVAQALLGVPIFGPSGFGALAQGAIANFATAVSTIGSDPGAAPSALAAAVEPIFDAAGGDASALDVLLDLTEVEVPVSTASSALGKAADANRAAPVQLLSAIALAEAVAAAGRTRWDSYQQAIAARDKIAARIDTALLTAEDASFEALRTLRATLFRLVPPPTEQLAQLATYTPRATLPAEVISFELYGRADRAAELVDRNAVRHPLFVPQGRPLEVLAP